MQPHLQGERMVAKDYRKLMSRGILAAFFGLLSAIVAPDLGLGIAVYISIGGIAVLAGGAVRLSRLPVPGIYRPLMASGVALAAAYCAILALQLHMAEDTAAVMLSTGRGVGAASLLCLSAAMEVLCKRLKWARLGRAWIVTEAAVALLYAVPVVAGLSWGYYGVHLETWRFISFLKYQLAGFEFHGMRLPGIVGGPRWLVLLLVALLMPVSMVLINLLRTYVRVMTPRPVDDSEPIPWSPR